MSAVGSLGDGRLVVATVLLVTIGAASEVVAPTGTWMLDLAVGVVAGTAGLVVVRRRARDLTGWLLTTAGVAWFAGTLAPASGRLGELGQQAQFTHRGLLLVALVVPLWRAGRTPRAATMWRSIVLAVVAGACLVSVGGGAGSAPMLVIVGGLTVAAAVIGVVGVIVPRRTMWGLAIPATVLWCSAASVLRSVSAFSSRDRLFVYELGVAATAVLLAASRFDRRPLADQVVDIGRRAGLGGALDDPDLRIGFGDGSTFRALDGSTVAPVGSQQSTELDLGDDTSRVLIVHRPGLLDDARVHADVQTASRLLVAHHRLIEEVQLHAATVDASRNRLVASEQRATDSFGQELERRVMVHLDGVLVHLDASRREAQPALALASGVRAELAELAIGSAPAALTDGLAAAIGALVASYPIPVQLQLDPVELDEPAVRILYFAVCEALSNVLKHSRATTVNVGIGMVKGRIELSVEDDGVGGVVMRPRGGLFGLAERLSSAEGSLECRERLPRGTSVIVRLPRLTLDAGQRASGSADLLPRDQRQDVVDEAHAKAAISPAERLEGE
jgi:signal transduction histidine kinase